MKGCKPDISNPKPKRGRSGRRGGTAEDGTDGVDGGTRDIRWWQRTADQSAPRSMDLRGYIVRSTRFGRIAKGSSGLPIDRAQLSVWCSSPRVSSLAEAFSGGTMHRV